MLLIIVIKCIHIFVYVNIYPYVFKKAWTWFKFSTSPLSMANEVNIYIYHSEASV